MDIYVGNLPAEVSSMDLRKMFETFGKVTSAGVVTDRISGLSRGFGFVEMPVHREAPVAIAALNGKEMEGRRLIVHKARYPYRCNRDNGRQ